MRTAIITGATSGLGLAIHDALAAQGGWHLIPWHLPLQDVRSEESVRIEAAYTTSKIDLLVNCAGVNYINWLEDTPDEMWDSIMDTNAKGMWLTTKHLLKRELFNNPATIVNIVSNASHIPMTHSVAYNASKGAAHIMTLQMARELKKRHNITVFGVSPNKMHSTAMTEYIDKRVCELRGWTPEEARAYQAAALPAGEETDPQACAEFIAFLLSTQQRHKFLNGCILPYGA